MSISAIVVLLGVVVYLFTCRLVLVVNLGCMEQHAILQPTTAHLHLQKVEKSKNRKVEKGLSGDEPNTL